MKAPWVGDDIYVPTIGDFFVGGLAKVIGVVGVVGDDHYVIVEEHEGAIYRWEGSIAAAMQDELKPQFGELGVIGIVGDDHYVIVEEHEGTSYRWEGGIAEMQDELKSQFGEQRAYRTGIKLSCPLKD